MREILFKAKRADNGEWVEGDLLRETDVFENVITRIYVMKAHHTFIKHEVVPETVSQYTGLTDKNGSKIWENDIVNLPRENELFVIKWDTDAAKFAIESNTLSCDFDNYWGNELESIGNVFDNPDLLKESEE